MTGESLDRRQRDASRDKAYEPLWATDSDWQHQLKTVVLDSGDQ
ncbi:hypothetical protein [Mycobacterium montefiorense]|nr:hypothetical protein [Mycobacterium montefiorense]